MLLSVVMPVYNERATIREIIGRVAAAPFEKEIIVVDDCSTDGTSREIELLVAEHQQTAPPASHATTLKAARHDHNRGKGAALRTGFGMATGDIVLIQDADLEYDPAEYPRLIAPITDGHAEVVLGSRFISERPHRVLYFWHQVANRIITLASNCLTNLNLSDVECCYKVFRREVLTALTIEEDRFGVEPELVAKIAKARVRVYEVGISYHGRTFAQGKKIGWRDGVRALWCILKYNTWSR